MKLTEFGKITREFATTPKMPVLFIGHGHPMNALRDNNFTQSLHNLGKNLPRPNAIMVVSAHWETRGTFVATTTSPRTIYDFGNFHPDLFKVKYPASGSPEYAQLVKDTVQSIDIQSDSDMGFDHGTWTVLKHIFPAADIPVFQLSLDYQQSPDYHYQLAKELYQLRHKGVMILSSGNIVHNLRQVTWQDADSQPYDWAKEFDEVVKTNLVSFNHQPLISYEKLGKMAQMSIPSNEHYLPLLYTIGLQDRQDELEFVYEGFEYGSISSRCFVAK